MAAWWACCGAGSGLRLSPQILPCPPPAPSLVIDTLKEVDETRRCYRMVGGVLVERTVKEVLPALENNKEQVGEVLEWELWATEGRGRGPGSESVSRSSRGAQQPVRLMPLH